MYAVAETGGAVRHAFAIPVSAANRNGFGRIGKATS
jgi:hypothetical protein